MQGATRRIMGKTKLAAWLALMSWLFTFAQPGAEAFVYDRDYLPIPDAQLGHVFPQERLQSLSAAPFAFVDNGITYTYKPDKSALGLKGTNNRGKTWQLGLNVTAAGGAIITADLMGHGSHDVILVLFTGGC